MSASDSDADSDYERDVDALHDAVELGFVVPRTAETAASLALHSGADWSLWDGGKVGGSPRWLVPRAPLPSLPCASCGAPLSLLLQIYCPLDVHEQPDAFHRALYVFVCKALQGDGCVSSGRVLRAQLPRSNAFYDAESGAERFSELQQDERSATRACAVCGQHAPLTCGQCRVARYCGKLHQREHWTAGGHKTDCKSCGERGRLEQAEDVRERLKELGSGSLFPEMALEIDAEPDASEAVDEHEAKLLADFERHKQQSAASGESDVLTDDSAIDVTQQELNEAIGALPAGQDAQYVRFLTRVALAKDQVLRYARWRDGSALWVHEQGGRAADSAPTCPRCGGPRRFEFQVLPQLLFYLKVDAQSSLAEMDKRGVDWGTLAVYTCEESCPLDGEYADEFLHVQPPYAGQ